LLPPLVELQFSQATLWNFTTSPASEVKSKCLPPW
jgi:hypothetical protein